MKMKIYKEGFFNLDTKLQKNLILFMVITSAVNVIQFLCSKYVFPGHILAIFGILVNGAIIYFSFFIKKAPNFYFMIIPLSLWFILIFDGSSILQIKTLSAYNVMSVIQVGLACYFFKQVMIFRKYVKALKKQDE